MDLHGQSIREIRKNSHNQYLIIAGQAGTEGGTPSGPAQNTLWAWDGQPNDAPQQLSTAIGSAQPSTALPADLQTDHTDEAGDWEGIADMPDPLTPGATVRLMMDQGFDVIYDDGVENKQQSPFVSKGRTDVFTLSGHVGTVADLTGTGRSRPRPRTPSGRRRRSRSPTAARTRSTSARCTSPAPPQTTS